MLNKSNPAKCFKKAVSIAVVAATIGVFGLATAPAANAGPLFFWGFTSFASDGGLGTTR
ncbi:MAG: hypothetical protein KDJ16_15735 [Hyphomicrobiales bacterium]|nr:hypothetical protein [Hyphomicrobiales bacterium]